MYKKYFKRVLDIVLALIILPLAGIISIIFGVMILIEDGFPIIYVSERRGKDGRVFNLYKLRSMKNNAPDIRASDGSTFNSPDDFRLIKIGKLIRKLSVDELPQIINVLKGDMSFIGPRPSLVSLNYDDLEENKKKRLKVLPGLTGYSQAFFRNTISQEEKIINDCWYVDNISFSTDIKIILKTIEMILFRKGIYNGKK